MIAATRQKEDERGNSVWRGNKMLSRERRIAPVKLNDYGVCQHIVDRAAPARGTQRKCAKDRLSTPSCRWRKAKMMRAVVRHHPVTATYLEALNRALATNEKIKFF
jgi:hypothetical protein